jgi:hypothetical protein
MDEWADGDLEDAFEERLDALLAELCPAWTVPELPKELNGNQAYLAYEWPKPARSPNRTWFDSRTC